MVISKHMLLGRSGGPLGNAQIIPMDPQVDANGQPYIPLYYHFTFESNFIDWHIKPMQKEIRYSTQRTRKVNDHVFLWFVMGIPNVTKLESMPRTQEYVLTAPHHSDLARRRRIMLESIDGSIFPVTEMVHNPVSSYFLNFEFFVSNRKTKELILPDGLFVIPPPSSKLEESDQGLRSKAIDDFSLKESISISVRTSKIRGSLIY